LISEKEMHSRPGEDDWCDRLEDLQDEVYGEQLLFVLITSRESVKCSGSGDGEQGDTKEDWHLSLGDSDDVGGNDVGDDTDCSWDHVV
jgi:hypothetical protein